MILKNIEGEKIINLASEVEIAKGQIVSKTLVQNKNVSITLFAFDEDEEISSHESDGDAIVTVLDGEGKFTIDGKDYILSQGQTIVMPQNKPHAVSSVKPFKMMLTVIF